RTAVRAARPATSGKPTARRLDALAELDAARDLVGRQVAGAVVDDLLGLAQRGGDHARDHHRAGERVGLEAGLRRLDLGEGLEAALDLAERDPLALDLDDVLAAGQVEAAGAVELAEVAGPEPAVAVALADGDLDRLALAGLLLERTDGARREGGALDP